MGRKQTSKELLTDSIISLSERYPMDQISVKMLTSESGVCIQTFYNHFPDKSALVLWIHSSECRRLLDKIRKKEMTIHEANLSYLQFCLEHEAFLLNAFNHTHGQDNFARKSAEVSALLWDEFLREKLKMEELPPEIIFELQMYTAATGIMTLRYLEHQNEASPEEFVEMIESSMPARLKEFLKKAA